MSLLDGADIIAGNNSKLEVNISSKRFCCSFELIDKVTILLGESGTGKSKLVSALNDVSGAYKNYFSQSIKVINLEDATWRILMSNKYNERVLFTIDDLDFICSYEFGTLLNSCVNCYFLIVCRTHTMTNKIRRQNIFSINVNSIFDMEDCGVYHYFRKHCADSSLSKYVALLEGTDFEEFLGIEV